MARTCVILLSSLGVLLVLITASSANIIKDLEKCKGAEHKVFHKCRKPCPPTCDNPDPKCEGVCKPGCFCKEGTVDNGFGECIEKEKCQLCQGNITYSRCGKDCQVCGSKALCEEKCSHGCFCKPGYMLIHDNRRCVLPQDCPTIH